MNDVKINKEVEELCATDLTIDEATPYISDILELVIDDGMHTPSAILAGLRLIVDISEDYTEHLGDYSHMLRVYLEMRNCNVYEMNYSDLVKKVESDIIKMYRLVDSDMNIQDFFIGIKNPKRRFVLVRYAVLYVLYMCAPIMDVSIKDISLRYQIHHTMRRHIVSCIENEHYPINENENIFVDNVKKYASQMCERLIKMRNFETNNKK